MYIGELARLSGCTPKAIRLYEQLGLLTPQRCARYQRANRCVNACLRAFCGERGW